MDGCNRLRPAAFFVEKGVVHYERARCHWRINHIEKLIADRARQLGAEFSFKRFMDEFHAAGMIPVSLIRWEMTGRTDEMEKLEP